MSDQIQLCDYAVAFIDLLGQRAAMPSRHITELNETTISEIKGSIGRIIGTQENFHRFYDGLTSGGSLYASLPEEMRKSLPDMAPGELKWQPFSDGMMVYVPLGQGMISSPVNSIFSLLVAAGNLCITGLAAKSPVRVGIDVAWALEYRPGELYGAALAHAYELESKVAQFPRVVVGQGLLDYLAHYASSEDESVTSQFRSSMAKQCLMLLARDENGQEFLDYAGESFANILDGPQLTPVLGAALQFAEAQRNQWQASGNEKLEQRYRKVLDYLRSRGVQ